MLLELGHSGKLNINTWEVLKCDDQLDWSFEKKVKAKSNILHTVQRKQTNWIGQILRRDYLLQHFIEGKMDKRR
jgi:hypothetical protein